MAQTVRTARAIAADVRSGARNPLEVVEEALDTARRLDPGWFLAFVNEDRTGWNAVRPDPQAITIRRHRPS